MPAFYPIEAGQVASPTRPVDHGNIRQKSVIRRTWNLASRTTSDTFEGLTLPRNTRPTRVSLFPSVSLGSSTIAVGIQGTAGKYRAAATVTTNVEAVVVALGAPVLAADEPVVLTIGAATLPASGTLTCEFEVTYE
jgi:hypothetical protein